MTELQLLGLGRVALATVVIIFALRGRYWWLASAGVFGFVVSMLVSLGVPQVWTARLAYGLYASVAIHALDVTRRVHPHRRGTPPPAAL